MGETDQYDNNLLFLRGVCNGIDISSLKQTQFPCIITIGLYRLFLRPVHEKLGQDHGADMVVANVLSTNLFIK